MPLRFLASVLFVLLVNLSVAQADTAPPVRIMPLGDSITYGSGFAGGYRAHLYQLLTAAGYNVDFVGSQNSNGLASLPDPDHEGHSGYRIDQIDAGLDGYLAGIADPDVVLLHIGTNDFGQAVATVTAIDRLEALITKIAGARPFAHIIVTNLMERTPEDKNTKIQAEFNPFVQARVDALAAQGYQVTFLDMRSAVPLAEMRDGLHPNQTGYDHMADAWFPAIQAVMGVNGDTTAPKIARVQGIDPTHVAVTFSKPIADAVATPGNFSINIGVTVQAAQLDVSKRIVTLTTSLLTAATTHQMTVNNVVDRITPTPHALAARTTVEFNSATPRGYLHHVPESAGYTLVQSLDVVSPVNYATTDAAYTEDHRLDIGPFDRVAYYVELQTATGDLHYAWVSMDAFTTDVNKIGVPTLASQAVFQQPVTSMNVVSNVEGVVNGTGLAGNLEFWPNSYSAPNAAAVAGASETTYDLGDTRSTGGSYGSMQVHNTDALQTVFAFNNWGGSATTTAADIGIGNDLSPVNGGVDWTFANNADDYTVKSIQVLVRTTGDSTPPVITSATAGPDGTSVIVTFSEPISAESIRALNFTVSGGVYVIGATLSGDHRSVILTTTTLPAGALTVTATGVRDSSASANLVAPSTVSISAPALPPGIVANIGAAAANYRLVATINLPVTGDFNLSDDQDFVADYRTATGTFTRIAYYLELQKAGGAVQYVWTAMDAFSANRARICLPTTASGAVFQKNVTKLDVISNVSGVTNGTGMAGGNIEFWPNSYTAANGAAVTGASATTYDFGDTRSAPGGASFGCMQVHDHTAGKTLFAINHFGADGNVLDIGIGSQATGSPDWTNAANAGQYIRRILHVLVLPGVTAPAAVTAVVPEAASYQLAATLNLPAAGNLQSGSGFKDYDVDNRSELGDFTRVAYYLELKKSTDTNSTFIWTSMDAFTNDPAKIGVPTTASGAVFQQKVSRLNVVSNVSGIVSGTNLATGNIEFFPSNYSGVNDANVPGASATLLDFGDGGASSTAGYGSMQVHNYGAGQTLWAVNRWGTVGNSTNVLCVGIGNNPAPVNNGLDWTFAVNADQYSKRLLHILVLPGSTDTLAPMIAGIRPSSELDRLMVSFSKPVADAAALSGNYALSGGLQVTGATLLSGNRDVVLNTTPQTPGNAYVLTVNSVRDRTPAATPIAANSQSTFTSYSPPAILAKVPETAGYQLAYQLAIPSASGKWNLNPIPYGIDESVFGEKSFDRVAYLLELGNNWAYASFDAFTGAITQVGVPSLTTVKTPIQQNVAHLNVASNVPGIVTGTNLGGGNIEFWGRNYDGANAIGIPNASETLYDFGDIMSAGGGWGTMQIHNHDAAQTILAYNNWGSNTVTSELGIGNNPSVGATGVGGAQQQPDWTFTANAATYATRNLYVLVRPGPAVSSGPAPELIAHPTSRNLAGGSGTTLSVRAGGNGPFTYQWRYDGEPIAGATQPWLDLVNLTSANSGGYDVVVTGPGNATVISQTATVTVANRLPVFTGYRCTATRNVMTTIPLAGLLAKATDPDQDTLRISGAVASSQQGGAVSMDEAGLHFTPAAGFTGDDRFTVTVTDGQGGELSAEIQVRVTAVDVTQSFPANGIASRIDGKIDTLFRADPTKSYLFQRSLDLLTWTDLQTVVPGDDGLVSFTDANPRDRGFYRLKSVGP